jgi:hypothetical protein
MVAELRKVCYKETSLEVSTVKQAHFLIDDVIWVLRDVARNRPVRLFDNAFLKMLKKAHDDYGVKTQLNVFYRTSYFYGNDEFSLFEMPDCYKQEWEAAADWLKLAFHAKEEFPDYPHVNAQYNDVKQLFETVKSEVFRFAGEKSFTYSFCPHWNAVSEQGVHAVYDCGVRIMDVSVGEAQDYSDDPDSLPYGHAMRLLNNRQPETRVYSRGGPNVAINNSLCAYNHLSTEQFDQTSGTLKYIYDATTGMKFKKYHRPALTLNLIPYNDIETVLSPFIGNEYIGICTHEQYFYEEYLAYQPDYAETIYKMGKLLHENGYEFMFLDELV